MISLRQCAAYILPLERITYGFARLVVMNLIIAYPLRGNDSASHLLRPGNDTHVTTTLFYTGN